MMNGNNLQLHTPDECMHIGLSLVGFTERRRQVCRETMLSRFRAHYGSNPIVYSELFEDLQTTNIDIARIEGKSVSIKYFLMAINFMQCYPTEHELSALFKVDEKTARKWVKFYIKKIHSLKPQKVCRHLFD